MEDIIEPLTALNYAQKTSASGEQQRPTTNRRRPTQSENLEARYTKAPRRRDVMPRCGATTRRPRVGAAGSFDLAFRRRNDKEEKRRFFESLDYARCPAATRKCWWRLGQD